MKTIIEIFDEIIDLKHNGKNFFAEEKINNLPYKQKARFASYCNCLYNSTNPENHNISWCLTKTLNLL